MSATHASFFSGVGGLDLGLERAGWRTVSFSEVDPYASAVLAQRWPGVPNLGDVIDLGIRPDDLAGSGSASDPEPAAEGRDRDPIDAVEPWHRATLWTGGFPCQGLSVAGKRRGLADERSGLAFAFLDLVGRHRPPLVLLENVPGLLSSHGGRDMAALLGALADLGYGVAYRVLDARHFGVPQRRRRVFIVGVRGDPDDPDGRAAALRAASVLAVGTRCGRHPATGHEAGPGATEGVGERTHGVVSKATGYSTTGRGWWNEGPGTLRADAGGMEQSSHLVVDRPPPDADRVRAPDGLAGLVDGGRGLANAIQASAGHHGHSSPRGDGTDNLVVGTIREHVRPDSNTDHTVYVKAGRAQSADDDESWREGDVMPTLNGFDVGDARTTAAVLGTSVGGHEPDGLDSHRYRCCGNGVVAPVAEWLGHRLMAALERIA